MNRLPIRARLTAVFAAAMVIVLAGAALFVYQKLRQEFTETVNTGLLARADAVAEVTRQGQRLGDPGPGFESQEDFVQVLAADGRVLDGIGSVRGPVLRPDELRRAGRRPIVVERRITGMEGGTTRVRARPVSGEPGGSVVVIGRSLADRDEVLEVLVKSFALGGPVAVVLASLIGYGLAATGLGPIEAMRRRAAEVSLSGKQEHLPLPAAHDEVRRLGETLNHMLDRMRQSFERERRFVGDASHELRTPIAILKTELESALRTGDYGVGVRESLVAAVEEADRLAHLAEDLLVLARATEGGLPVRPEQMEGRAVLDGVRDRFADRAAQHHRRIDVDAPADAPVFADPLRLRQALSNLLDNALRHGSGNIVLAARPADGGVEIEVGDEGPGFPAALAERAFERFARGDEARSRGGAGLGLAIVRSIAEAHGGTATIVSGPGSRVRLSLPGPPDGR